MKDFPGRHAPEGNGKLDFTPFVAAFKLSGVVKQQQDPQG
jgi:hypothetical protein